MAHIAVDGNGPYEVQETSDEVVEAFATLDTIGSGTALLTLKHGGRLFVNPVAAAVIAVTDDQQFFTA